ncbi:hypothetical protein TNCV_149611 [Trichonephila clavipes]|nr:hypothetical protein TNCV_149611 [Trichonephila clavipes]
MEAHIFSTKPCRYHFSRCKYEELSSLTLWWNRPQHLDIPEQFTDPSITSSYELYMLELKKQSDISLTSILDFTLKMIS